ncbi:hypothetical protein H5410_029929 [Solanum commersonii]|uniref:Uncharacterized protein n=1 Tax=Solanum commersonii TaxID=4109 RepID=A0A9J5YFG5_SOLCO|nr:hypothetical protein H5410_029929 [Solanum commersonii]
MIAIFAGETGDWWSFAVARWPELLVTLALLLRRGISGGCSLIGGRLPELLPALARWYRLLLLSPVKFVVGGERKKRREGEEKRGPPWSVASHRKWTENEREEEAGQR